MSADFRRRLHAQIVAAFTAADLTKLAQFDMDVVLANVVYTQAPFDTVAFEFVGWCHRLGRLRELLVALAKARDQVVAFAALLGEFDTLPPSAPPTAADLARFAALFAEQLPRLTFLKAYKELHEILHDLDGQLASFQPEADARAAGTAPIPPGTAEYLTGKAAQAEEWAAQVQFPQSAEWVKLFRGLVGDFLGEDAARSGQAFKRIKNLPSQQLEALNTRLVDCARLVTGELDVVHEWRLDGLPKLAEVVTAFRRECVRVRDLTDAHDACQLIDREFRAADDRPGQRPADLGNWDDIRERFDRLSELRPNDPLTARVADAVRGFEGGTAPPPLDPFANLVEKFTNLFEAVDRELLNRIQPLLTTAFALANFLRTTP